MTLLYLDRTPSTASLLDKGKRRLYRGTDLQYATPLNLTTNKMRYFSLATAADNLVIEFYCLSFWERLEGDNSASFAMRG